MFAQACRLLDDMIGIIEEFQPFRCKTDAMAVSFQNGNVKFFLQFFYSCTKTGLGNEQSLGGR